MHDRAKALIFFRHHLHEGLKSEYLTIKYHLNLRLSLKERYDHQETMIFPKTQNNWLNLMLQDFKTVSEYNSTMFNIPFRLKLCEENIFDEAMMEKKHSVLLLPRICCCNNNIECVNLKVLGINFLSLGG
ncbi:hypothetical protein Scep_010664 [Stephania cephalantha]|uniref:Uncharacterized protein n=1 Tax=Stephania cephalantha TaxID=152367 RepID=A0AAP0JVH7_9MAGN